MGKKMNLFTSKSSQATLSWPWPSCRNPKTLSFRSTGDMLKTINAVYVDASTSGYECLVSATKSTKIDDRVGGNASDMNEGAVEEVINGLRLDHRLSFDLGETRSILKEAKASGFPFDESVALVMDSRDPFVDFKNSMEEMVEAHGLRDWEKLEELLNWYLRENDKKNHGYVIGAFVDLLVALSFSSLSLGSSDDDDGEHGKSNYSNSAHDSMSSPLSFSFSTISTSPCLSS